MKRKIEILLGKLNRFGKDKWQHFAVGAVLAAAGICLPLLLGLFLWVALLLSATATLTAAVVKERAIDPQADIADIAATLAGGAVIWGTALLIYFTMT